MSRLCLYEPLVWMARGKNNHPNTAVEVKNQYFCLTLRKIILMTTKFIGDVSVFYQEIVKGHESP